MQLAQHQRALKPGNDEMGHTQDIGSYSQRALRSGAPQRLFDGGLQLTEGLAQAHAKPFVDIAHLQSQVSERTPTRTPLPSRTFHRIIQESIELFPGISAGSEECLQHLFPDALECSVKRREAKILLALKVVVQISLADAALRRISSTEVLWNPRR